MDTALFSGKARDYTITYNADSSITIVDNVGNDGTDTLQNIERLGFTDQVILADGSAETARIGGVDHDVSRLQRFIRFLPMRNDDHGSSPRAVRPETAGPLFCLRSRGGRSQGADNAP